MHIPYFRNCFHKKEKFSLSINLRILTCFYRKKFYLYIFSFLLRNKCAQSNNLRSVNFSSNIMWINIIIKCWILYHDIKKINAKNLYKIVIFIFNIQFPEARLKKICSKINTRKKIYNLSCIKQTNLMK